MSLLTIMPSGKSIEVTAGTKLLTAILAADESIHHKCEGKAACGTCHIFVQEGRKGVSRIAREENERLDTIVGVGSKSRLACQAIMLGTEDVKIELLGFSSGV
ncbi:2Fe-2S iron-sulfur cluster-binding protein [Acidocella sp.]|uniref:2Fe-2S iron-sulfur cluster-binding protein n=1 Tax=Acidocella sp. TaxID=50710 RepID=UPI002615E060|nr:2Fe-2S iron-sulfur cluster-binding protein [Acidocella sp.]